MGTRQTGKVIFPIGKVEGRHVLDYTIQGADYEEFVVSSATASDSDFIITQTTVFTNSASATESISLLNTFDRSFGDSIGRDSATVTDLAALTPGLGKGDSVSAIESITSFNIGLGLSDSSPTTESLVYAITKALSDSSSALDLVGVDDGITFQQTFSFTETVPQSDDVAVLGLYLRNPSDSAPATESIALAPSLGVSDTATIQDSVNDSSFTIDFVYGRPLDDSTSATEASVFSIINRPSDTVTTSDAFDSFDIGKVLGDTATITQTPAIAFAQGNIADSVSATESILVGFGFEETAADSTSATDSPALTPNKVFGDSAITSEAAVFASNLGLGDSVTATESLVFAIAQVLADSAAAAEAKQFAIPLVFNDSSSALDSGQGVRRDYFDSDYVVEPPSADSAFDADSSFTFT